MKKLLFTAIILLSVGKIFCASSSSTTESIPAYPDISDVKGALKTLKGADKDTPVKTYFTAYRYILDPKNTQSIRSPFDKKYIDVMKGIWKNLSIESHLRRNPRDSENVKNILTSTDNHSFHLVPSQSGTALLRAPDLQKIRKFFIFE